jgi:hypothetical protein
MKQENKRKEKKEEKLIGPNSILWRPILPHSTRTAQPTTPIPFFLFPNASTAWASAFNNFASLSGGPSSLFFFPSRAQQPSRHFLRACRASCVPLEYRMTVGGRHRTISDRVDSPC